MLAYFVIETVVEDESGKAVDFYGVRAVDGNGNAVFELPDISDNKSRVEQLINLLSDNKVETNHIEDVIEDIFWS